MNKECEVNCEYGVFKTRRKLKPIEQGVVCNIINCKCLNNERGLTRIMLENGINIHVPDCELSFIGDIKKGDIAVVNTNINPETKKPYNSIVFTRDGSQICSIKIGQEYWTEKG